MQSKTFQQKHLLKQRKQNQRSTKTLNLHYSARV